MSSSLFVSQPGRWAFAFDPRPRALLLGVVVALLLAPSMVDAHRYQVRKPPRFEVGDPENGRTALVRTPPNARAGERERPHPHLEIGGRPESLFERRNLEKRPDLARGGPDTLVVRVAVIRVEFATDRLGPLTTGNGRMLRENADPSTFIDPAPHNDAYFQAHLTAVDRYWSSMTYGFVRIEGDVYPRGQEFGSYELTDMADYGPESEEEFFSIDGLTRYSRESLIAADADPDLAWTDYDVFFVVHAGSDWQNDIFQDTPFDLPTFSIVFSDSDLVVTDTADTLTSMITYPETSSQDGFHVALNGGIAHEMGHQLGLLDLYNVETFAPTVSLYDVMDSGNLTRVLLQLDENDPNTVEEVIGVLPSAIGAWSRWLVTFRFGIDPVVVKSDSPTRRLRAIQSRDMDLDARTAKWYQIPISETEYFLVENRVDNLDGGSLEEGFNTALDADDATGVVLGPVVGDTDEISHNYDLLIDPGVLIWHIDERQALANLSRGRGLNVFFDKRSITIEEADGIVDIGSPFSIFPQGTDREAFFAGNNANFTPTSRPNSDSNTGSPSGISILNISQRDTTMTMDFLYGGKPAGWPMEVAPYATFGTTSVAVVDTDGDGTAEVAVASDSTAWMFRYDDGDGDGEVDVNGAWPAPALGSRLFGTPSFSPTLGDLDGDGNLEMIVATDSGAVHVFRSNGSPYGGADSVGVLFALPAEQRLTWEVVPADLDGDGADELYTVHADGMLRGYDASGGTAVALFTPRPILGPDVEVPPDLIATLAFADLNGDGGLDGLLTYLYDGTVNLHLFGRDGRRFWRRSYPLPEAHEGNRVWVAIGDIVRDRANVDPEILLATEGGWLQLYDSLGEPLPGWPRQVPPRLGGPPALGDIDADGLLEIVVASNAHVVSALNYNGTLVPGWPVAVPLVDFPGLGRQAPGPAIADVDGDGYQDVIVGLVDFNVHALDRFGKPVLGFPIVTGGPVVTTPAIIDGNGDGRLELYVHSTDGQVYARILPGQPSPTNPQWSMYGNGPRHHASYDARRLPTLVTNDALFAGAVQVYPNPVSNNHGSLSIRYTLGTNLARSSGVEATIYNIAGEEVRRLSGTAEPNTENVITLPVSELASGVYLCSLKARSGAREETRLEKFAVIR